MIKECLYCHKKFNADRKIKKFCSYECSLNNLKQKGIQLRTKKCLNCGKIFTAKETKQKFCSMKCSGIYNGGRKHTELEKDKISQSMLRYSKKNIISKTKEIIIENTKRFKLVKKCKVCGCIKCDRPDVCSQYLIRKKSINLKKLGFDFTKFGSKFIYDEYDKIKDYILHEYFLNGKSLIEICQEHNMTCETSLCKIMDMYKIDRRSLSDAIKNCILHNRIDLSKFYCKEKYKQGYHKTWNNKSFYYRSSYELNYAIKLDNLKIDYIIEGLRIPYFNTHKNKYGIAIPDFYIPSKNLIVEIKGDFTYDRQEIIDRFKSYKKYGYDYKLILEGKDIGKRLPKNIQKNIYYYFNN